MPRSTRPSRGPDADGRRRRRAARRGGLSAGVHAPRPGAPPGGRPGRARGLSPVAEAEEIRREWFDKDYYAVLGVPKNASQMRSRRRIASSRNSITPTRTLATPRRRSASRRSPRPTTWSATRRSGPRTTAPARWARVGSAAGSRAGGSPGAGYPGRGSASRPATSISRICWGACSVARRVAAVAPDQRRGADLETSVALSFEDAMAGVTVPVKLTGPAPCRRVTAAARRRAPCRWSAPPAGVPGKSRSTRGSFRWPRPVRRVRELGGIIRPRARPVRAAGSSDAHARSRRRSRRA